MSKLNNVLILIGSPKGKRSASNNFASYIENRFKKNGVETETDYIVHHQKADRLQKFVKKAFNYELMVMVAPLYIDSIPAVTIKFMEEFSSYKKAQDINFPHKHLKSGNESLSETPNQKLFVVFNSGFPEPSHNDLAIQMCEIFAHRSDMEWTGGITIGMGAAFQSRSVKNAGGMARNLRKGLDAIVDNLTLDEPILPETIHTASKPLMPLFLAKFIMRYFGGFMWKGQVKDDAVKKKMYDRPYAE